MRSPFLLWLILCIFTKRIYNKKNGGITMRKIEHFEKRAGGKGTIHIEHLLEDHQKHDINKLYAKFTIDVDSSIGIHQHVNDTESYTIVSGKGKYYNNGTYIDVYSNDVLFCDDGQSHGLENTGDEPLVFFALIQKKD